MDSTGLTQANGASYDPDISSNGAVVAFETVATNLPDSPPCDQHRTGVRLCPKVYVHDRQSRTTAVVPRDASQSPALGAAGRLVAFTDSAGGLITYVYVFDRVTGITTVASVDDNGQDANASSFRPAMSADADVVAFASLATNLVGGDTNGVVDVFTRGQRETVPSFSLSASPTSQRVAPGDAAVYTIASPPPAALPTPSR